MERRTLIERFRGNKRLVLCARFLFLYALFLFIARHSTVFRTGAIPKDILSLSVVAILVVYRFFSIALVPGLVFLWICERFDGKRQPARKPPRT